mgnify:CR=1 FL=1
MKKSTNILEKAAIVISLNAIDKEIEVKVQYLKKKIKITYKETKK